VIDEIELAQQMDVSEAEDGTRENTKFLPPYMHTLYGTDTATLDRLSTDGKLKELNEMLTRMEQTLCAGLEQLKTVCAIRLYEQLL
jgi:hypothetical protein